MEQGEWGGVGVVVPARTEQNVRAGEIMATRLVESGCFVMVKVVISESCFY